ncbi:hypothetical protein CEXT_21181 [Caerostris extrusa]|uniref:Uncharacterized protein n=1 Tax=Caerostris extrusa TaxID=172846 RepID=A0AAV4WYT4_CAEEX|nr:hypothetical protein CEXT_21181 [Caerostris extrusa]
MARPEVGILQKQSKKRQKRSKLGNKWLHFGELGLYVGEADVKRYRLSMSEPLLCRASTFSGYKRICLISLLSDGNTAASESSRSGAMADDKCLRCAVDHINGVPKKMLRTAQSQTNAVYGNLLLLSM